MKKFLMVLSIIVVGASAFSGYKSVALAASRSEVVIPRSGDLCNGTGGNGQIVNIGKNAFTINRKDGRTQIIHLTNQVTIQTSAGSASVSDLKAGDRVTLIGGSNPDGSFTANTVVVCAAAASETPPTIRKEHTGFNISYNVINLTIVFLFSLIWFGIIAFLRLRKKKTLVYLMFFTLFYVYLYTVLDFTLFQYQPLIFEKYLIPGLMLHGIPAGKSLNLYPLITLTLKDLKTTLLNILLMIPFGFGLPFITSFRMKKVVLIGISFSVSIEFLQFITGYIANITFRVADINDVIFNSVGVVIGYILFIGFVHMSRHIFRDGKISTNPILRQIADRPQIVNDAS